MRSMRPSPTLFRARESRSKWTDGYFEVVMYQRGLLRPLKTSELSDGTLRYLLLIAGAFVAAAAEGHGAQ